VSRLLLINEEGDSVAFQIDLTKESGGGASSNCEEMGWGNNSSYAVEYQALGLKTL
jgi:hypothetical protein